MGTVTDSTWAGWYGFTAIAGTCFDRLRTPKYVIVNISGLRPNPAYEGDLYPVAYNGNTFMPPIEPQGWLKIRPEMSMRLVMASCGFQFLYKPVNEELYPSAAFIFDPTPSEFAILGGHNQVTPDTYNPYIDGDFSVTWIPMVGPNSTWAIMKDFGFDHPSLPTDPPLANYTKLEVIAQPNNQAIMRFARKSDHSCIRITIDKHYGEDWPALTWLHNPITGLVSVELFFYRAMDTAFLPSINDFFFQDIGGEVFPAETIAWATNHILTITFHSIISPVPASYLDYTRGTVLLTDTDAHENSSWDHMYFA